MMCDKCNERAASLVITKIIGGKHVKLYLCEKCAAHNDGALEDDFSTFQHFLSSLINVKSPVMKNESMKCEKCGMTIADFKKTSKVGCASCYKTFQNYFNSLAKRIHQNTEHTGKRPGKHEDESKIQQKINHLQKDLQIAVVNEEYELAAKIRDEIKLLKKEGGLNEMV